MNKQVTIYFTKKGQKAHISRSCRHIKKRVVTIIKIPENVGVVPCHTCFKKKEAKCDI